MGEITCVTGRPSWRRDLSVIPAFAWMTILLMAWPTSAVLGVTAERPDSCLVTASDLPRWRVKSRLMVVDTRSAEAFREVRIAGSANVPAFALATKAFLRDRPLLLVGDVADGPQLRSRCEQLLSAGFPEVAVLEAGLRTWARHAGPLVGRAPAKAALGRIAPRDLLQAGPDDRWLVVDTSAAARPVERAVRGRLVRLPLVDASRFRKDVERAVAKRSRSGRVPFVVLADADGRRVEELSTVAESLDVPYAFVLDGGLLGLGAIRDQQARITAASARGCTLGRCGQ